MRHIYLALVLLSCCLFGCGNPHGDAPPSGPNVDLNEQAKVDSPAEIKKMLEAIAESGEGGSGLVGLRPSIEGLSSPNKEELLADLDKLEAATDPEEVKKIATRMAGKL